VNVTHPYGYPVAIALLSIAAYYLVGTWQRIDSIRETRRNRRFDPAAKRRIRKQLLAHIPQQRDE
jgi:hypothetical protein